jgi:chitodextrinase
MFFCNQRAVARMGLLALWAVSSSACQGGPEEAPFEEALSGTAPAALVSCTGVPTWNASTIYNPGDRVVYQGSLYEALVAIWTADPVWGTASGWYKLVGACSGGGTDAGTDGGTDAGTDGGTDGGGDKSPPSQVTGLRSTGVTATQVSLAWNASTDNVGVTGYLVLRNGTQVGTTSSLAYTDSVLSPSTQYSYTLKAKDAAGNTSTASAALSVTTAQDTNPSGSWHPSHVAVGTVYEPFTGTDGYFNLVNPQFPAGKRLDYGYLYLNGGAQFSEWHSRAVRLATKSKEQGMTPIFVVYGIGGNADSPAALWGNLQSASFLTQYFQGLRDVGQTATSIMGTGRVGYVIEPDTLGYLQQQYAAQYNGDPSQMPAATYAAYDSGVLQRGVDPAFPNTVTGLVQSINHALRKYTPKAFLGWQLNLWAAPGAPSNGIAHSTEVYGFEAGKTRIQDNARANAGFALKAGVKYGGAEFISIDKYGLDGAATANVNDPASSLWFWNADLWNNYLLFVRTLKDTLSLPVVLWQIPAGHINGTTRRSPTVYNSSGTFPLLDNSIQRYEESASPFFFGDTLTLSGNRLAYFSKNVWSDPKITVSGSTVTWGSHMQEAANAGVVAILMGAGVGASTRGIPQPGAYPEAVPTDGYYWITRVQEYYASPVKLP